MPTNNHVNANAKPEVSEKINLRDALVYTINAYKQRKASLENFASNTINPLDRIIANERVNEVTSLIDNLETLLKQAE